MPRDEDGRGDFRCGILDKFLACFSADFVQVLCRFFGQVLENSGWRLFFVDSALFLRQGLAGFRAGFLAILVQIFWPFLCRFSARGNARASDQNAQGQERTV